MKMLVTLALLAVASPGLADAPVPADADAGVAPAPDQRRGDQSQAYQAMRDGRIMPLPDIQRRVVPTMKGAQYIGFDFDSRSGVYTLKFLRDGVVIWVDVDGHSGQILGRTGR